MKVPEFLKILFLSAREAGRTNKAWGAAPKVQTPGGLV
jgi:hypothetical protein